VALVAWYAAAGFGAPCVNLAGHDPVAAGEFYPSMGWSLRPEVSALLMSASSMIVALNAVSLRRDTI